MESVKDVYPVRPGRVERPLTPIAIGEETQAELECDYEDVRLKRKQYRFSAIVGGAVNLY